MMDNIYGRRSKPEAKKLRIQESNDILEGNKDIITKFLRSKEAEGLTASRLDKLGSMLYRLGKLFKVEFDKAGKEELEEVICELNSWELMPSTILDYRKCLRQLYRYLNDGETPKIIKGFKFSGKRRDDRYVDQVLTQEDILAGVKAATNIRDKALIMLLYETGGRVGEILTMRIKDFTQEKYCAKVRLKGKTGERVVPIIDSVPTILKYLEKHHDSDNSEAFFWQRREKGKTGLPLGYNGCRKMLKEVFERAGIKKKVNPHIFRHSRATKMASGLTEVQLCKYFGWVIGSGQTRTYIHLSGRDLDNAFLKFNGIKIDDEKEQQNILQSFKCPRCNFENGAGSKYCSQCRAALDMETALVTERTIKEETDKAFQYLVEISKNPELMEEFLRFKHMNQ